METWTLDNLPARGMVYVFGTGERWTPESLEWGDTDERGWVDPTWCRRDLHVSRNDVDPFVAVRVADLQTGRLYANGATDSPQDVREEVLDAIRDALQSAAESSERGNIYAADSVSWDLSTNEVFIYAAHVTVKYHALDGRGWVEEPVHIDLDEVNR